MSSRHIVKVVRTCNACPSQWDLYADDGTYYYARYRWGEFSISTAPLNPAILTWDGPHKLEGEMSDDEMKRVVSPVFTFEGTA